jgi:hypothetical protein
MAQTSYATAAAVVLTLQKLHMTATVPMCPAPPATVLLVWRMATWCYRMLAVA